VLRGLESFEEGKENKLEYTQTFDAYTTLVEKYLEEVLSSRLQVRGYRVTDAERRTMNL
jgi:hypothetical protein